MNITNQHPWQYNLLPYNGINPGYRTEILDRIAERLIESLQLHSQVLTVPLVIRFPTAIIASPDNNCFQYFIEEYRRCLRDHGFDPHYVWVTEKSQSLNQHYHLILMLNGNKIRYFSTPPVEALHLWGKALQRYYGYNGSPDGLIHVCCTDNQSVFPEYGCIIHRGDIEALQRIQTIYSYYAKVNTKGFTENRVREFGASLLKARCA